MSTRKKSTSTSTKKAGAKSVAPISTISMSIEPAGPTVVIEPRTPAIPIVPAVACDRCGTLHHLGAPTYATLGAVMIGEDGAAVTERMVRVCLGGCIFAHLDQMREALGAHARQYPEQKIIDTVLPGPADKVGGMVPNAKSTYSISIGNSARG